MSYAERSAMAAIVAGGRLDYLGYQWRRLTESAERLSYFPRAASFERMLQRELISKTSLKESNV